MNRGCRRFPENWLVGAMDTALNLYRTGATISVVHVSSPPGALLGKYHHFLFSLYRKTQKLLTQPYRKEVSVEKAKVSFFFYFDCSSVHITLDLISCLFVYFLGNQPLLQPRVTSFKMYYDRGDLPIKMEYLTGGDKIGWTVSYASLI